MFDKNNICRAVFLIVMATLVIGLAGCMDDPIYKPVEIPDAEVEIRGEVIFKPLVSASVQTRSGDAAPAGAAYKGIKSLYVFFFNADGEKINNYCGFVNFTSSPSDGSTHEHITFKKKVRAGRYFVYAVVNISDEDKPRLENISSIDDLRQFRVDWNDDIANDLEMFGVFRQDGASDAPDNENFENDQLLTITPATNSIRSWVRRAVSKVTVDFDGSKLKDGVTVYIRKAVLKKVPSAACLGAVSRVDTVYNAGDAVDDKLIQGVPSKYSLDYGTGASYSAWPKVTRNGAFSPEDVWGESYTEFHDDNARALPCYENMQGTHPDKSKLQDSDGDGIIDADDDYDGIFNGTYLEVEGYYVADRPEYKSSGKIIYRFMLGKDALTNYDVVRNHHYKITMCFKGYGNDLDWHIDYGEQYLDATYPVDVDYRGYFFVPSVDYSANMANGGHDFDNANVITLTSYRTGLKHNTWLEPEISYTYYTYNEQTRLWELDYSSAGWLSEDKGAVSADSTRRQYTFVASMAEPDARKIDNMFSGTEGSKEAPYDLSTEDGDSVRTTANCYMVGHSGWYSFPLVYGNAITDGKTNDDAYSSSHIVNHLNKKIIEPYIIDNGIALKDASGKALDNIKAQLIWQDVKGLVSDISYEPSLYGGKGGIKFQIKAIKEGNAVIALIDNSAAEDDGVVGGSTKAIWSWHIWATSFGFNLGKDTRIVNHQGEEYDVMHVNLGWCAGDKGIRYYKPRKCDIKFKIGEHEIVRTIVQHPHFVLPRGDHPYYQWGRKDPFVGSNAIFENKIRYDHTGHEYGTEGANNPPRIFIEPDTFMNNIGKKHSIDCQALLVKNPDKWHNAPRWPDPTNPPYKSINKSYSDLWSINGEKTVYDPCPRGYQVGDSTVFTGFTTHGLAAMFPRDWLDVLEEYLPSDFYDKTLSVNRQVLVLYTDTRKIESITFPVSGYRDYDARAEVVQYPSLKWNVIGESYIWFNQAYDPTYSAHFKFHRSEIKSGQNWEQRGENTIIDPSANYYNTDGFGIRPVRIRKK